jgi:hypothetical protein
VSTLAGSDPPFDFGRLPGKLRDLQRWLLARGVQSRGQAKQQAFTLQNENADLADPHCMASFTAVQDVFERNPGLFDAPAIALGEIGDGIYLAAIHLHNCIDENCNVAYWAQRILDLFETYVEHTLSGGGFRVFFFACAEIVRAAPASFGYPAKRWGCRRRVGANGAAVAISFAEDFAPVTGRALPDHSSDIGLLSETLLWQLAQLMAGVASETEDAAPKPTSSKREKHEHLEADRAQIAQFVDLLFRYADEGAWGSLRIFSQFDRTIPPPHIEGVQLAGDNTVFVDAATRVATRAANMTERAVFAPPIATFESATRARAVDICNGLAISVEIDEGDTSAALDRLEQVLGTATVVVASGGKTSERTPKLHPHWRLNEPTRDAERHRQLQHARLLAALLVGADLTGVPPAHPYRWPGSWHRKVDPPMMARIIAANPAAEIDLDETIERLEGAVEAAGVREANARAPQSQSGEPQQHPALLRQWVTAIPNLDVHYKVWVDLGYACCHAFGGEPGFEPWEGFSKKSAKYNADNQAETWKRIKAACTGTKPPRTIGAGTLCKLAQAAGWKWTVEAVRLKEERAANPEGVDTDKSHPSEDADAPGPEPPPQPINLADVGIVTAELIIHATVGGRSPKNYGAALARALKELRRRGHSCAEALATIHAYPKGIAAKFTDPILVDLVEKIFKQLDVIAAAVAEFNGRYMVVNESGTACVFFTRRDPVMKQDVFDRLTFGDLRKLYSNRLIEVDVKNDGSPSYQNAADLWLGHPDRKQFIHGVVFDPTEREPPEGMLNLWRGYGVDPKEGDWSLLRDHLRVVICSGNDTYSNYLMDVVADAVQHPEKQGEVCVVLIGVEGCGKGIFLRALASIFGQHGLHISDINHLTGRFNAHLRDKVFVFADEIVIPIEWHHVDILMRMVSEPTLTIEQKYRTPFQAPNLLHIFISTNKEWAIPASLRSRRWFVLRVSDERVGDHAYFAAIQKQLDEGGLAAMLHELLHRDLSRSNIRAVPVTEALNVQRVRSLEPLHFWWLECLSRGYVWASKLGLENYFAQWHPVVTTEVLYASYKTFATVRREERLLTRELFGKELVALGAKAAQPRNCVIGEHLQGREREPLLIIARRAHGYRLGSLRAARAAFSRKTGLTIDWNLGAGAPLTPPPPRKGHGRRQPKQSLH